MIDHPSFDITGSVSDSLKGKKIVHCITGSVAAMKAGEVARALMRRGAAVFPVMTQAACELIHPNIMEWSTGNETITELTGKIEHVALAGNVADHADLLLIAPSTANTISKIACGIDDTAVTTFVTTAFGEGIPIVIVPAMHEAMYNHPILKENIKKLQNHGVHLILPEVNEGKAKIPSTDTIVEYVDAFFARGKKMTGKKVLVTAGRTVEYIDPIRVITNNSSGKMGMAVAEAARDAGAEVTVVYGKGNAELPRDVKILQVDTAQDMFNAVHKELENGRYDVVISAAAVGDWAPVTESEQKISTHTNDTITITLKPTPKIIDSIKEKYPDIFLTAFRANQNMSFDALKKDASKRMAKAKADMIVMNDTGKAGAGFESDTNEVCIITKNGDTTMVPMASKKAVGREIISALQKAL